MDVNPEVQNINVLFSNTNDCIDFGWPLDDESTSLLAIAPRQKRKSIKASLTVEHATAERGCPLYSWD